MGMALITIEGSRGLITIEEVIGRWYVEVEAGGMIARCERMHLPTFDDAMTAVIDSFRRLGGDIGGHWVAEVEVGGMVARKEVVRGNTFDDVMSGVIDAYRRIVPVPIAHPKVGLLPPLDTAALPPPAAPPVSKTRASRMRAAADEAADAVDPGASSRRNALRGRRLDA